MILTLNQLEEISPYTNYKRLELILPNLNSTLIKYQIWTSLRISHFLTQLIIESNYFRYIQDFSSGMDLEGSIELGNTRVGDGRRFVGRGYIKIRGRKEYKEYKKSSDIDILAYPHFVTTPKTAIDVSGWVWDKKKLNILADQDDLSGITKLITGAYINMKEREELFKRVEKVIKLNRVN